MTGKGKVDKDIKCVECSATFTWTVGEQEFYADKEMRQPKRCRPCRERRKAQRSTDVPAPDGGDDFNPNSRFTR